MNSVLFLQKVQLVRISSDFMMPIVSFFHFISSIQIALVYSVLYCTVVCSFLDNPNPTELTCVGATMVPISWTEMQCPSTGQIEQRKVAKVGA